MGVSLNKNSYYDTKIYVPDGPRPLHTQNTAGMYYYYCLFRIHSVKASIINIWLNIVIAH